MCIIWLWVNNVPVMVHEILTKQSVTPMFLNTAAIFKDNMYMLVKCPSRFFSNNTDIGS